jgi:hypothetical protein
MMQAMMGGIRGAPGLPPGLPPGFALPRKPQ